MIHFHCVGLIFVNLTFLKVLSMESVCICVKAVRLILSIGSVLLLLVPLMGIKHMHQGPNNQLMGWSHKLFGKSLSLHSTSVVYLCSVKRFLSKKKCIFTIQYSILHFRLMHYVKRFIYRAGALWWKRKIRIKLTLFLVYITETISLYYHCFFVKRLWGITNISHAPPVPLCLFDIVPAHCLDVRIRSLPHAACK